MAVAVLAIVAVVLLAIGVPVGISMGFGMLALVIGGFNVTSFSFIAQQMYSGFESLPLVAIPCFMLAGSLMETGGLSKRLVNCANAIVGHTTGGPGTALVIACMFFGAISGSGPATTAAMGGILIPYMVKAGYDRTYATGLAAVAGGLGIIVPPSIPLVVYGVATNTSIGNLFLAGLGPALVVGGLLIIVNYIISKRNGYLGQGKFSIKVLVRALWDAKWALFMPVIILGGIYGGICSPTEAATISIFYSLIVSLFIYRTIKIRDLPKIMLEGIHSYAPILIILSAAVAFARVITLMNVATIVSEAVLSAISSKVVILLLINVLLLFVGMIMDTGPAILVFTPVLLPVAEAIGVDPIHFGIIMCVNLAIGFVTPPMGANLFVASNLSKVSVFDIARKAVPFILAFLIALLLITFVPQISMFLLQ